MSRMLLSVAIVWVMTNPLVIGQNASQKEGLKPGEAIGAFYVTKVAGAVDDDVEPGDYLCYRCRYGSSPMVMVFARQTGGKVPQLVKQLDSAVAANEDVKLKGLLTLMGDKPEELTETGKKIAQQLQAKKIPVVIAEDAKTGPLNYKLPGNVDVTIVVAKDSQVVSTHSFAAENVDVAAVMRDVKQMLN